MFISFKPIAAAVVLGIFAVSMPGVMAQQQPAPSTLREIRFEGDMTTILTALPSASLPSPRVLLRRLRF